MLKYLAIIMHFFSNALAASVPITLGCVLARDARVNVVSNIRRLIHDNCEGVRSKNNSKGEIHDESLESMTNEGNLCVIYSLRFILFLSSRQLVFLGKFHLTCVFFDILRDCEVLEENNHFVMNKE